MTRKSVTKESDAVKEIEKKGTLTGTMGRKNTVPYALYRCHGFVNPFLAKDTGFTHYDLELLWGKHSRVSCGKSTVRHLAALCVRVASMFLAQLPSR